MCKLAILEQHVYQFSAQSARFMRISRQIAYMDIHSIQKYIAFKIVPSLSVTKPFLWGKY